MANIKSSKKGVKQIKVRHLKNLTRRSDVKTYCKKVETALTEKDLEAAKSLLRVAESKIARARGKGLLKKNTASRKISRLAQKVAQAAKASS
ncbi:30S ribosomal protein S20 [Candidatus Babeliales bacterium]|nr:30S ribosomal protein S20 [Candidatus Babeliales bacterium]